MPIQNKINIARQAVVNNILNKSLPNSITNEEHADVENKILDVVQEIGTIAKGDKGDTGYFEPIYQNSVITAPASDAVYIAMDAWDYVLPTTAGTQTITVTAAEVDPAGDYDRVELRYNKVADTWTKVGIEKTPAINPIPIIDEKLKVGARIGQEISGNVALGYFDNQSPIGTSFSLTNHSYIKTLGLVDVPSSRVVYITAHVGGHGLSGFDANGNFLQALYANGNGESVIEKEIEVPNNIYKLSLSDSGGNPKIKAGISIPFNPNEVVGYIGVVQNLTPVSLKNFIGGVKNIKGADIELSDENAITFDGRGAFISSQKIKLTDNIDEEASIVVRYVLEIYSPDYPIFSTDPNWINAPGSFVSAGNNYTAMSGISSKVSAYNFNSIPTNIDLFVVYNIKDGAIEYYQNGIKQIPSSVLEDAGFETNSFNIKQLFVGGQNVQIRVKDIALFDRVLTPAEINLLNSKA